MWVQDEIRAAVARTSANAVELSGHDVGHAEAQLERVFARPGLGPLWDRLRESVGLHNPSAWRRLIDFVQTPCLLLVRDSQGSCGYRFETPTDLLKVLADTHGFEFYITDEERKYLIAFNHHDVLIGCGDAAPWIRTLKTQQTAQ